MMMTLSFEDAQTYATYFLAEALISQEQAAAIVVSMEKKRKKGNIVSINPYKIERMKKSGLFLVPKAV